MRRVVILGSTGSIGQQAIDVVKNSPELEVVGLAAQRDWELLLKQADELSVKRLVLADETAASKANNSGYQADVGSGEQALIELVTESDADLVLNAIVGAAGLGPTVAALGEGIDVALANKESLVVAGELVMPLAEGTGARLLPVDSEHSAIFQLLADTVPGSLKRIVLTASGGPFCGYSEQQLESVTVEQALKHPTWQMGGKITVDSATLMNKGLELIEAKHLFSVDYDQIDVVVHPQSIVHSMIDLYDGSTLAHLGYPDMRVPISYALHYPDRAALQIPSLDLTAVGELSFKVPDTDTFRCLRIARDAGSEGGLAPCVMNAANEVAVAAFLKNQLSFVNIPAVIEATLDQVPNGPIYAFGTLIEADRKARAIAQAVIDRYS